MQGLAEFLDSALLAPEQIQSWREAQLTTYFNQRYDGELGWISAAGRFRHAFDGALCEYGLDDNQARRMIHAYAAPCRVSAFGDSFTYGDQVNDGETYPERLAANINEPIRNFGVSNYSVYQTYLRMVREQQHDSTKYILFGIYLDDHVRNINVLGTWQMRRHRWPTRPFLAYDASTGEFIPRGNPGGSPDLFEKAADPSSVRTLLATDPLAEIYIAFHDVLVGTIQPRYPAIEQIAERFEVPIVHDSPQALGASLYQLVLRIGLRATLEVVKWTDAFARERQKTVVYILSYSPDDFDYTNAEGQRIDTELVDFLEKRQLPYVDLMAEHRRDFSAFQIPFREYAKRYWVPQLDTFGMWNGHYNPYGNLFHALTVKKTLEPLLTAEH